MTFAEVIFGLVVAGTLLCMVGWPLMLITSLMWCVRDGERARRNAAPALGPPPAEF